MATTKESKKYEEKATAELEKIIVEQTEKIKRLEKELKVANLNLAKIIGEDEFKKLDKRLSLILGNHRKTPYEKKIDLFNLIKDLKVGESQPLKEQRMNYLLESRLYDMLSKRALEDYRKTTIKAFSKAKVL